MQNRLVKANEWSLETFGIPGSLGLTIGKHHLKTIRAIEKVIVELAQVHIPDLGGVTGMTPASLLKKTSFLNW